jgi:hypothetical protein
MFSNFNTYLSDKWDKFIRPKGLRAGVLRALRLTATGLNNTYALFATKRYSVRKGYSHLSISTKDIQPYSVLAGSNTINVVAGTKDKDFKYILKLKYAEITAFMKSVGSTKVFLRNADFVEHKPGVYLFKQHPGIVGVRTIEHSEEKIAFAIVGGTLHKNHMCLRDTMIGNTTTSFVREIINNALINARRTIGTASSIISAVTGTGISLIGEVVKHIWKESDSLHMVTASGVLHKAAISSDKTTALNTRIQQGAVWCANDDKDYRFLVPTDNGYDVVLTSVVTKEDYPDTYKKYPDIFIDGKIDAIDLRSRLQLLGIRTIEAAVDYTKNDTLILDSNIIRTGNDIIVQYIS